MAKPQITLYVDIVSPFAYLAFHVLRTSPLFADCDVTYIPIFLGGVMKACGNTPPIRIKNKDKWIERERNRWARLFNVPISDTVPEGFPPNTLAVQRALSVIATESPALLPDALAALYRVFWVEGRNVVDEAVMGGALAEVVGREAVEGVLEKSKDVGKKALTANTERALEEGCFGLPYFLATNAKGEQENFWGFDHLGQVVDHLGIGRAQGSGVESGWRAML
ncbi:MAG: hypothetical protein M1833_001295 [Piccolia ochrophora]|nr:MAG: hypothetical protein M1833_001295 [Piccolia ochrophora]